jgi:diguanylate cyclase (GGDEF)-like protein
MIFDCQKCVKILIERQGRRSRLKGLTFYLSHNMKRKLKKINLKLKFISSFSFHQNFENWESLNRLLQRGVNRNRRFFLSQWPLIPLTLKQAVVVMSLCTTGLVYGVRYFEALQGLELLTYDQMVRWYQASYTDPRILVVAITETDLQVQNQWPLRDQTLATLLEKLQQYQPKVIGLDLYRNLPQPPGYSELKKQLQAPNLIAITKLGNSAAESVPPPPQVVHEHIGFNDLVLDPDGIVRRNFMYAASGKERFYSFSLRLSLFYLQSQGISLEVKSNYLKIGQGIFPHLKANSGGYQNIDDAGYQILLNYRSPAHLTQQVTLTDVLNNKIEPAWVKDKIVLIGTTAPSLKDQFFTPYSSVGKEEAGLLSGVLLHAQQTSQILRTVMDGSPLIWFWPEWSELLWIWGWAVVGGLLAWRLRHPVLLGVAVALALISLLTICFSLFTQAGWIPFVAPALSLMLASASVSAYRVVHSTLYDPLTSLPNRTYFLQRLQSTIAGTQTPDSPLFAVLLLGLDRFKIVIDSLGHQTGDQLLIKAARRLKTSLTRNVMLARVGGDEFAILIEKISDATEAMQVADRLQKQMILPFQVNGQEIFTSVSIGIALNQAEHDYRPEELLRDAHTAMYRAKTLGKARYEVFATGMRTQALKRLQTETDLRRALEQDEFVLHYQPIISLSTGTITGFEALVRWQHPTRGMVSPAEFIPVAEETELIVPLGQWIFKQACSQLSQWQNQFSKASDLIISINLSPQQFLQPNLVESLEEILKNIGIKGQQLKLEITESLAMKDVESSVNLLLRLKALNLQLSLDDFGTGYSSLSYLHRFPFDTLKVDRSFVNAMDEIGEDAAIVKTIIMLGHTLGMDVVAEGVETASQMEKLKALNCEYGQGYYFSKPLASEAATALLKDPPQWLTPPENS